MARRRQPKDYNLKPALGDDKTKGEKPPPAKGKPKKPRKPGAR